MTRSLTAPAPRKSTIGPKNRVWDFFVTPNKTRPANRRNPQQLRWKIRPTTTKPASGIPYWLSRDPIEEEGGVNLYGYVLNNPISYYDVLGLDLRLEGTSAAKGFHRRVSVTYPSSPKGFYGQSFGLNLATDPQQGVIEAAGKGAAPGMPGSGIVYIDLAPTINTVEIFKTTPAEDDAIKKAMDKELGNTGPYNQWSNSCRDYSKDLYNRMKLMVLKMRPPPPPPKIPLFPIAPIGY